MIDTTCTPVQISLNCSPSSLNQSYNNTSSSNSYRMVSGSQIEEQFEQDLTNESLLNNIDQLIEKTDDLNLPKVDETYTQNSSKKKNTIIFQNNNFDKTYIHSNYNKFNNFTTMKTLSWSNIPYMIQNNISEKKKTQKIQAINPIEPDYTINIPIFSNCSKDDHNNIIKYSTKTKKERNFSSSYNDSSLITSVIPNLNLHDFERDNLITNLKNNFQISKTISFKNQYFQQLW